MNPNTTSISPPPEPLHRILVVDDNRAIHEDFRKILGADPAVDDFEDEDAAFFGTTPAAPKKAQFELDFASQGLEALDLVTAAKQAGQPYSVVFMDVRMPPGLDGIETTARLWDVDPDLQVIICTAYSDYSWEGMVDRLGLTDRLLILKKPFDVIEVIQCAHALTGKWLLLQQSRHHAEWLESAVQARTAELEKANIQLESEVVQRRLTDEALRITQFSVDHSSEAIFRVSADSSLLYANQAAASLLGYSEQNLHEMSLRDIMPELGGDRWQQFWESLREDRHRISEGEFVTMDSRKIPVELTVTSLDFADQELLCVSARDITVRKQILEELSIARDAALESVRLKTRFLANMSHEIRTPMNGVVGMSELLLHTPLDADQRDYVDTIRGSADLLLNLINDLLDSSKIEAGSLHFEASDFNIHSVVEGTLDIVGSAARHKGLELAGYIGNEVFPLLRGDAGRLRQVVTNILSNAVKFTNEGEVILSVSNVTETEKDISLLFEVRDTGIGIAKDLTLRIFEPFVQADGSDARKYGGTGLGLSISRQIVEALGGEIGVESELGKGSRFWFTASFEKQSSPASLTPMITNFPDDFRVLVVDDNATNRKILQLQLSNLHMRSSSVAGADEAIEMLREENNGTAPFGLALLDMQMPGMDGLSLARLIKSDPATSGTRLLLLSSLGDHLTETTLNEAGVEGHLVKPLKQTRLQTALTTLLSNVNSSSPAPAVLKPTHGTRKPASSLRILLAEDNVVNQRVTLLQLQRLGYTADIAKDGVEVLNALETTPYDVILMDCQMPTMDGYAATREIRARYSRPIHIIAMTANAMPEEREMCLEAGMNDFLSKPVSPAVLGELLEKAKEKALA